MAKNNMTPFLHPIDKTTLDDTIFSNHADITVHNGIPVLVKDEKQIAALIDDAKNSHKSQWYDEEQDIQFTGPYRHHMAKRRNYLERILPNILSGQVQDALDIGCGDGNHTQWLGNYAKNVYGSDYNIARLERAKNKIGEKRFVVADITDYPAQDNYFDLVFFHHVLEHIPDDVTALNEIYRITKPGGVVVLGVPNEGAVWWQFAYKLQPRLKETTDHVHFYTMDSLRQKVLDTKFLIEDETYIGWGIPHFGYDGLIRQFKFVDDFFSFIGPILMKKQASSLFMILRKPS